MRSSLCFASRLKRRYSSAVKIIKRFCWRKVSSSWSEIPFFLFLLWFDKNLEVNNVNGEDNDDADIKYTGGSGTVLGVGYKIFPFISVNLEYSNTSTSTYESSAGEVDRDINYQSYLLSVSLPLSL